jgi:hypothetical protein
MHYCIEKAGADSNGCSSSEWDTSLNASLPLAYCMGQIPTLFPASKHF